MSSNIVIGHFAAFCFRHLQRPRSPFENGEDLLRDVIGLEGLAIILQNAVLYGVTGLSPQVPRELPAVIDLDTDRSLAAPQYLERLLRVERMDILEVKPVHTDAPGGDLRRCFLNDSLRGPPADECHVRVLGPLQLGRGKIS